MATAPAAFGQGSREWNQSFGNAAATSSCDVAAIRDQPDELWRMPLEEILGGPVVSGDRIFVVAVEQKERRLLAIDRASGAVKARFRLDKGGGVKKSGPVEIVALQGSLVAIDEEQMTIYRVYADSFRAEATIPGRWVAKPCEIEGFLLACEARAGLTLVDVRGGKVIGSASAFGGGQGRPIAERITGSGRTLVTCFNGLDDAGNGQLIHVDFQMTPAPRLGTSSLVTCAPLDGYDRNLVEQSVVVSIANGEPDAPHYLWLAGEGGGALCKYHAIIPIHFKLPPVAIAGRLVGIESKHGLVDFEGTSGKYLPLVAVNQLPPGAAQVAPSLVGDTLFHGNWAVEATSGRVLWCLPQLAPKSALIPTGDHLAVVVTQKNELVGLGDPARATTASKTAATGTAAKTTAKSAEPEKKSGPVLAPSEGPGLVLADGGFAKGKVEELPAGAWRLTEAAGAREFVAGEVAWANLGTTSKLVGSEQAVLVAWLDYLRGEHRNALVRSVERFLSFKQPAESRRLLEELKRIGATPAELEPLTQRTSSTSESKAGNAALQKKKALGDEKKDRDVVVAKVLAAADACGAQGLKSVASVLVGRARQISSDPASIDLARVRPWIPSTFPFAREPREAELWIAWAEALLPSGATFALLDMALARRVVGTPFERQGLLLRTQNLMLITCEYDPVLVGGCLSRGESTVRTLQVLFGKSPVKLPPRREEIPLEVRLHATRAAYLADPVLGDFAPPEWSAGFYIASDAHSRFYSRHENAFGDFLGRQLHEVMSHELTHQYIDRRWVPENPYNVILSGYWLVEGMAEFFGEQSVELGRRNASRDGSGALDDTTVRSLEACVALERKQGLIPLAELVSMSHVDFAELDPGPRIALSLPHHLGAVPIDRRGVFYFQSAALVYFAYHHCGERGRQALGHWLKNYYQGHPVVGCWKEAGFDTCAAFEEAFKKFLAGL